MKKLTPHHIITPKGGRVAARVKRHAFRAASVARVTAAPVTPGITPVFMRRTRPKGSRLGMED